MRNAKSEHEDSWYKRRGYIHFDRPVSKSFAFQYLSDIKNVERHAFFPFIRYIKSVSRYKHEKNKNIEKERSILYSSHLDSHIYSFYANELGRLYEIFLEEQGISQCVLAYRSLEKSNIDFSSEAFDEIEQRKNCTALAFDLTGFFDNIDHKKLKALWCKMLNVERLPKDHYKVFQSITNYAFVDRSTIFDRLKIEGYGEVKRLGRFCSSKDFRNLIRETGAIQNNEETHGIPQGSPISAVLSNIFLAEFDISMAHHASKTGGTYRRYCDDILWICDHDKSESVKNLVEKEIRKCGKNLSPNPEKTEVSEFREVSNGLEISGSPYLQYLGFTFDGQHRRIRPQTLSRYYRRMKSAVRHAELAALENGSRKIHRKKIYEKYSHLGKRSFISYAFRSSKKMGSEKIRKQVRKHWASIHKEIDKAEKSLENEIGKSKPS